MVKSGLRVGLLLLLLGLLLLLDLDLLLLRNLRRWRRLSGRR